MQGAILVKDCMYFLFVYTDKYMLVLPFLLPLFDPSGTPLQLSLIYFLLICTEPFFLSLWIQLNSTIYHITSSNILINALNSVLYLCFLPYVDNSKQFSILLWNNNRVFPVCTPAANTLLEKKSYKTNWISFTFVITYCLSPSGPLYKNCCRVGGLSKTFIFHSSQG